MGADRDYVQYPFRPPRSRPRSPFPPGVGYFSLIRIKGFVGSIFVAFLSFLAGFFDAMVFLLHSDCPHGRSRCLYAITVPMSTASPNAR